MEILLFCLTCCTYIVGAVFCIVRPNEDSRSPCGQKVMGSNPGILSKFKRLNWDLAILLKTRSSRMSCPPSGNMGSWEGNVTVDCSLVHTIIKSLICNSEAVSNVQQGYKCKVAGLESKHKPKHLCVYLYSLCTFTFVCFHICYLLSPFRSFLKS